MDYDEEEVECPFCKEYTVINTEGINADGQESEHTCDKCSKDFIITCEYFPSYNTSEKDE